MGQRRRAEEMLSIASHELRTPLAAIRLHLDGIMRDARRGKETLSDRTSRRLGSIARQVARLERLVGELLEGRTLDDVRPVECDLAALVREMSRRLDDACKNAGCEIRVRAPAPVAGRWDRLRLEQVITNLLSNAAKYGAGAPIEIGVVREDDRARLWVRDHGIGISAEDSSRIFDRGHRTADAPDVAKGSGLGLWIVREIVTAHGGEITVDSTPGDGSTFTVELPLEPAEQEARV